MFCYRQSCWRIKINVYTVKIFVWRIFAGACVLTSESRTPSGTGASRRVTWRSIVAETSFSTMKRDAEFESRIDRCEEVTASHQQRGLSALYLVNRELFGSQIYWKCQPAVPRWRSSPLTLISESDVRNLLLKGQWRQMVTFRSVQCHPGLTYIFNFWHSGIRALRAERQSARMSEIKNVG